MTSSSSPIFTRIRDTGPPTTVEEIGLWESELGATLPADYAAFLLLYNGGGYYDETLGFCVDGIPGSETIGDFSFFGLNCDDRDPEFDLRESFRCYDGRIPARMIPIGNAGSDLLTICLETGSVSLWLRDSELAVSPELNVHQIAGSFSAFADGCSLDVLRTPDEFAIEDTEPFLSIEQHRLSTLRKYLDEGGNVDAVNDEGQTLLYVACRSLDFDGAVELLEHGANPDDGDRKRMRPPIWAAASAGAGDLVRVLLRFGAARDMGDDVQTPVLDAIRHAASNYIRQILLARSER